jgi:hypothetical protein
MTETEIAQQLNIDQSTISRDVMALKIICIYILLMGKPAPDSRPKLKTGLLIVQPKVKIASHVTSQ